LKRFELLNKLELDRDQVIGVFWRGDRNTSYFHVVASQRFKKKRIECIMGPQGLVSENREILKVAAWFYKHLFKKEERGTCSLSEDFLDLGDSLTREECEELEAPFTEEEIKLVVFSCYPEGALALMEFLLSFIKGIWR
jgi:hypothetical protein